MNHLLLFENFYRETTQAEFGEKVFAWWNCEEFTKEEIEKITPLVIPGIIDRYVGKKYRIDIRFRESFITHNIADYDRTITIVKLKDEWYYIIDSFQITEAEFGEEDEVKKKFYKCDQFEGLISFLKKNINT